MKTEVKEKTSKDGRKYYVLEITFPDNIYVKEVFLDRAEVALLTTLANIQKKSN